MAEGEGGGKGKLIKLIIMGVVALLLLGGIGIGAYLWFFSGDGEEEAAAELARAGVGGGTASVIEDPVFLPIGTFIVNLADGRRYLKTNLELMLNEEVAKIYLSDRLSEVKDLVVSELQTLSTEQLRDPGEREQLKQRLLSKIESLLPTKDRPWDDPRPIKKVLITEFYLQ